MSYYCAPCDSYFTTEDALNQHKEASSRHTWYCEDCDSEFSSKWALTQHFAYSSHHHYCQLCDEHFDDEAAQKKHDEYHGHVYCDSCNKLFETEELLHQHAIQDHWYCKDCCRVFDSESSLHTHLTTSDLHHPRIHSCPGCSCSFIAYGDLALHLESGTCPGGSNRRTADKFSMRAANTNNVVVQLIGSQAKAQVAGTWATERAWNGYQYECVLCHNEFGTLRSLNAHLGSPVHVEPHYHCPTMYHGCSREFTTLGGLLSHIERGECGVTKFRKQVTATLDNATSDMAQLIM